MLKKILCAAGVVLLMAFSATEAAEYDAKFVATVRALAKSGDAVGQGALADCYYDGICEGVPQDYAKAREWYEKAAAQGNAPAQTNLGKMYANGKGVRQDYTKARELWEKAAAQGHASAQYNLGVIYANGKGARQSKRTAKEWFGKACDNGLQQGCDKYRELNESGY